MTIGGFVEDQFPPNISAGAKGGPQFSTSITKLSSGFEQRNINWARELMTWDISAGVKTAADFRAYQKFFYARRGKAVGFRFKDWSDYRVPFWEHSPGDLDGVPVMFTTDGSTTHFQMVKTYTSGGITFSRKITKPVSGTVQVLHNGVQVFSPASWTVDTTTGIITLASGIYTTTGHTIAVASEFDVPVRFDTDELNATMNGNELVIWDAIPVVGLKI
jgi:uncharacterized protein (TIGR02217 family)